MEKLKLLEYSLKEKLILLEFGLLIFIGEVIYYGVINPSRYRLERMGEFIVLSAIGYALLFIIFICVEATINKLGTKHNWIKRIVALILISATKLALVDDIILVLGYFGLWFITYRVFKKDYIAASE